MFRKTTKTGLAVLKNYTGDEAMEFKRLYHDPRTYSNLAISKTLLSTNNFTGLTNSMDASVLNRFTCFIEFKRNYTEQDTGIKTRILNNSEVMDWLLTNSINAYNNCKGVLQAKHTRKETMALINKYDDPIGNLITDNYEYITPDHQRDHAEDARYTSMKERVFNRQRCTCTRNQGII